MNSELLVPYTAVLPNEDRPATERLKKSTKLLVIGQSSMVGKPFSDKLIGHPNLDLVIGRRVVVTKKEDWKEALTAGPVDGIVLYAAYTNVKDAQGKDKQRCIDVNIGGVTNLLETMVETGVKPHIFYVSTNLVFPALAVPRDGQAFAENEPIDEVEIAPRIYAGTKAIAERLLSEFVHNYPDARVAIARVNQPIVKEFAAKLDYLRKHLDLARNGKLYPMVTDAWIGLTDIDQFAQDMTQLIEQKRTGVFHFSTTRVTPYDLMVYATQKAGIDFEVKPATFDTLVGAKQLDPYLNPRFSDLGTLKTRALLNQPEQPWQSLVDKLVVRA